MRFSFFFLNATWWIIVKVWCINVFRKKNRFIFQWFRLNSFDDNCFFFCYCNLGIFWTIIWIWYIKIKIKIKTKTKTKTKSTFELKTAKRHSSNRVDMNSGRSASRCENTDSICIGRNMSIVDCRVVVSWCNASAVKFIHLFRICTHNRVDVDICVVFIFNFGSGAFLSNESHTILSTDYGWY